jgi:hypothetical protein
MSYTLVTFHAHPDDEAITTAGTMMRAKADGQGGRFGKVLGDEHEFIPLPAT